MGALLLMDDNDACLSLKDIYGKIAEENRGCCWELFEVYRHLKSLGYIVVCHDVPWTTKGVMRNHKSYSIEGTPENNRVTDSELKNSASIVHMLSNLQVDALRPDFDIYLPNSKFRKSAPGQPAFLLCLIR